MTLLVVDIGNTTTKVGVWEAGSVAGLRVAPTREQTDPAESLRQVAAAVEAAGGLEVALSSVVAEATKAWADWCRQGNHPLFVVRGDSATPLVNRYRTPERLGPDRLAAAVGAWRRCGAPVIVVSVGTTVVVDAVSSDGEYLGGAIWVGMSGGFEALAQTTAALPKVSGQATSHPIGADTEACIRAGATYGTAALVEGLAARMRGTIGESAPLVVTGGDADTLSSYLKAEHELVPTLTLEGIAAIWEHNREGSDADR